MLNVLLSWYPKPVAFVVGSNSLVFRKSSSVLYIGGEVYTLMYAPYANEGPKGRMRLDDVRRIDWNNLYEADCVEYARVSNKANVIRFFGMICV